VSAQGVVTHKKAYNDLGFNSVEGHKFCPGTQVRSRDELSSMHLGVTEASLLGTELVSQPATEPLL